MRRQGERVLQVASLSSIRSITSATQFNPIHDFGARKGIPHATDIEQFKALVSNPGPLRITFSHDYLDWYNKAYNNRARFEKEKEVRYQKFSGNTVAAAQSASAGLSNKSIRPKTSLRRGSGENQMAKAQATITEAAVQHGLYDVYERQPQFPNIHIDKCDDDHIRAIFHQMILPSAITSDEIWEKALMYRALLVERHNAYPSTFDYIKEHAKDIAFVPNASASKEGGEFSSAPSSQPSNIPKENDLKYFTNLVKKYNVQNANEAAVVLQCHRHPEADRLLFSNPPPVQEAEEAKVARPESYPPLAALTDDANISLLRCLIFGDFNCMVSTDPFVKFPEAASYVLRPKSENTLLVKANQNTSIATYVTGRRGSLLAPFTMNTDTTLDSRGRDVIRAQQNHANADVFFNKELAKRLEAEPSLYAADRNQYNPRAIRPEVRDFNSRRLLRAIRAYDSAESTLVHRDSNDGYEAERNSGRVPGLMGNIGTLPTIAHFANLILSDKHISFCITGLPLEKADAIRQCVVDTAEVMYAIAREYHLETQRLVLAQKLKVVASLLDFEIASALRELAEDPICGAMARNLGSYTPMASRKLNEMGHTTTARADDFARWMRPVDRSSL